MSEQTVISEWVGVGWGFHFDQITVLTFRIRKDISEQTVNPDETWRL